MDEDSEFEDLICPISGILMQDPVLADDNHNYERSCIQAWFKSCQDRRLPITSPWTRSEISTTLRENPGMKQKINFAVHQRSFVSGLEGVTSIHCLKEIFSHIDPIRDILAECLTGWQPPQLVVVGSESSGKSSLLQRLLMMPIFPTAEGLCTRLPIEVRLRNSKIAQPPRLEVFNIALNRTEEGPYVIPVHSGNIDVRDAMQKILDRERGHNASVSSERMIVLHLQGPHVPSLDLVDMPGLIAAPQQLREETRGLLNRQIQKLGASSIYLAVVPAGVRPNTSIAMEVIQANRLEARTLGVFTKCDELRNLSNLSRLLQEHPPEHLGGVILEPHGWYATMNAFPDPQLSPGASCPALAFLRRQAAAELDFFRASMDQELNSERTGCVRLIEGVSKLFLQHMRTQWVPATMRRLGQELDAARAAWAALGIPAVVTPSPQEAQAAAALAAAAARRALGAWLSSGAMEAMVAGAGSAVKQTLARELPTDTGLVPLRTLALVWAAGEQVANEACCSAATAWARQVEEAVGQVFGSEGEAGGGEVSFRLRRFPAFLQALERAVRQGLGEAEARLAEACRDLVRRFHDPLSTSVTVESRVEVSPPVARLLRNTQRLAEGMLLVLCQAADSVHGFLSELPVLQIALQVQDWTEVCAKERLALDERSNQLESIRLSLMDLFGLSTPDDLEDLVPADAGGSHMHAGSSLPAMASVPTMYTQQNTMRLLTDSASSSAVGSRRSEKHGLGSGQLRSCGGVVVTKDGLIVASDPGQHCLFFFQPDGQMVLTLGCEGSEIGQLRQPMGLAVDEDDGLLVADFGNHRVQKFFRNGSSSIVLGGEGSDRGKLKNPADVAVDLDGRILVAEWGNSRIQVFARDGGSVHIFDFAGGLSFKQPWGLTVARDGNVVIADSGNHRILLLGRDGSLHRVFGYKGTSPGEFDTPWGVCEDREGNLVVSEYLGHRVQIVRRDGSTQRILGSRGNGAGQLQNPCGIAVDASGRILVADSSNGRINIF